VLSGLGCVAAATYLLVQVNVSTQATDLILPLALTGAGMGLMMMPLNTHIINAAPRALVSRVTSLTNALQQVVNGLTIAALATILTARATSHIAAMTAAARAAGQSGAAPAPVMLARLQHELVSKALALGFDDTFRVMVGAAIAGAVIGVALRRDRAARAVAAPVDLTAVVEPCEVMAS